MMLMTKERRVLCNTKLGCRSVDSWSQRSVVGMIMPGEDCCVVVGASVIRQGVCCTFCGCVERCEGQTSQAQVLVEPSRGKKDTKLSSKKWSSKVVKGEDKSRPSLACSAPVLTGFLKHRRCRGSRGCVPVAQGSRKRQNREGGLRHREQGERIRARESKRSRAWERRRIQSSLILRRCHGRSSA
jgi:hypothetical protein